MNESGVENDDVFLCQRPLEPLLLGPPFFPVILFVSTTLLNGMTGISLHCAMQWLLTSQLHGSFFKENKCFFFFAEQTLHALILLAVSPPVFDTGAWNEVLCGS
jgi:hypothetical protein